MPFQAAGNYCPNLKNIKKKSRQLGLKQNKQTNKQN
jgi:hypothetical protein